MGSEQTTSLLVVMIGKIVYNYANQANDEEGLHNLDVLIFDMVHGQLKAAQVSDQG